MSAAPLWATAGLQDSSRHQQRHQAALAVKSHQIVATAHMGAAHKNLRHRAPASDFHHGGALLWVGVDSDFFNLLNALGLEQAFSLHAIRADGGGVHLDSLHRRSFLWVKRRLRGYRAFRISQSANWRPSRRPGRRLVSAPARNPAPWPWPQPVPNARPTGRPKSAAAFCSAVIGQTLLPPSTLFA